MTPIKIKVQDGVALVRLARASVEILISDKKINNITKNSNIKAGVFVTIYHINQTNNERNLRGCAGYPFPEENFYNSVIFAAIKAATEDPRFIPIDDERELNDVVFEVSVLTTPTLVTVNNSEEYLDSIVIGRHGLIFEGRYGTGLFLPQVPVEQRWDIKQYLSNLCYKAGAPSNAWLLPKSRIYRFTSLIFKEGSPKGEIYTGSTLN